MRSKISVAWLRQLFSFFFLSKFNSYVSKICVASLHEIGHLNNEKFNFFCFFRFFKKFGIYVRKSVLHGCVSFFHLFFSKLNRCVSRYVWHRCTRQDSYIRKKLSFFLVAEKRCVKISVALLHQFFFCFFKKFGICIRKSVLQWCVSRYVWHDCMR